MTYIPEDRHRRWAEETTTHQDAPRWVVPTWWPPLVFIGSNISYIFHKKSPSSFSSFEVVQNRWPGVAFSGPNFQLLEFSFLVCSGMRHKNQTHQVMDQTSSKIWYHHFLRKTTLSDLQCFSDNWVISVIMESYLNYLSVNFFGMITLIFWVIILGFCFSQQ